MTAPAPPATVYVTRSPWWLTRLLMFIAALFFFFAGLDFGGHEVITRNAYVWLTFGLTAWALAGAVP